MAASESNFYKYLLPALVAGFFLLAGIWYTNHLSKDQPKLLNREKIEVKAPDGTVTTKLVETFR